MRALDLRHSAQHDTFAVRLRAAREHARLTVDQLAGKVSATPRRLTALEAGASAPPPPALIGELSRALAVPDLWLMAGTLAGGQFVPSWYIAQGGLQA